MVKAHSNRPVASAVQFVIGILFIWAYCCGA
jgi:hypothetical protein